MTYRDNNKNNYYSTSLRKFLFLFYLSLNFFGDNYCEPTIKKIEFYIGNAYFVGSDLKCMLMSLRLIAVYC